MKCKKSIISSLLPSYEEKDSRCKWSRDYDSNFKSGSTVPQRNHVTNIPNYSMTFGYPTSKGISSFTYNLTSIKMIHHSNFKIFRIERFDEFMVTDKRTYLTKSYEKYIKKYMYRKLVSSPSFWFLISSMEFNSSNLSKWFRSSYLEFLGKNHI